MAFSRSHPSSPANKTKLPFERVDTARKLERGGSQGPGSAGVRAAAPADSCDLSQRTRHLEGVLSKYTNLLQGWQNRYFVLDAEQGQLDYFVSEQSQSQKPRGSLPLSGASVVPHDELPHMFCIYATNGEIFKLRASDAREQQLWMTQLQLCTRQHLDGSAKTSPIVIMCPPSPCVSQVMSKAEDQQKNLVHNIESLPSRGPMSSLDQDFLLLKATSAATLSCLGECLNILQHNVSQAAQHLAHNQVPSHNHNHNQNQNQNQSLPADGVSGWSGGKMAPADQKQSSSSTALSSPGMTHLRSPSPRNKDPLQTSEEHPSPEAVDPSEETTDTEDNEEEDLGVLDDQRSIILHLLSQLKLGMDLTRVVLPTFILEKRSLLEMYANFMAHPDLFLAIGGGATPEERMVRFVEYYLTSFHEGRKGAVAKKPYNPVLGENFRCTWDVPRERVRPLRTTNNTATTNAPAAGQPASAASGPGESGRTGDATAAGDRLRLRFVAEQVSHHPPVSGFYCECKERRMCVNAHVWTKSKFMGMSIGVSMVGEGALHLLEHDEVYVFTLPSAYARSILTVPWVELGGKVSITCAKSGYSAAVTFHTKPFYGGKVHRVTAEVKQNSTGTIICKAQGEWNGTLEFTYSSGETKVIDTCKLPVIKKKIRPTEKQGPYESRRLWQNVTSALKSGNMDVATEHKHQLEERQRSEERQRAATNTPWKPKHFSKEGGGWVYHNPLWKAH
ncbi:oxysterol-binding protein-related protein 10 isoform X2 [Alosa alosa]|uniref:oxysterol-binding protein-related protein 10 isoform X2 n=1 Tax=Alosa alosa TaxID=278164 RepID=UPI0020151122|nr:oxysterol-binding protein-related protein 10 isoform X2 [Alosa alosa]